MGKRFVRNIRDTKVGGNKFSDETKQEPFYTNMQNDILSDKEDVFIRNKKEYHCLTDNLKLGSTNTERIVTIENQRNNFVIDVIETVINSNDERLIVKNTAPNMFRLDLDLSVIENHIATLQQDLGTLQTDHETLETNFNTLQNQYNDLLTRVEELEGDASGGTGVN